MQHSSTNRIYMHRHGFTSAPLRLILALLEIAVSQAALTVGLRLQKIKQTDLTLLQYIGYKEFNALDLRHFAPLAAA
jgi:hypothetical protein